MRNKYLCRAHVLERDFRAVLRCFAHDLPALTAAKMCGVNKNPTHRVYGLLRQRVVGLAEAETTGHPHRQVLSAPQRIRIALESPP